MKGKVFGRKQSYDSSTSYERLLSPSESDWMIQQACEALDAGTAQQVKAWYASRRNEVMERWQRHQWQEAYGKIGKAGVAGFNIAMRT